MPDRIGQEPGWTEWSGPSDTTQSITTVTIPMAGLVNRADQKEYFRWVQMARQKLSGQ